MAAARRRLGHLAGLEAATATAERKILEAAEKRLAQVEEDLAKARRRALLHDGAATATIELTSERARLREVIRRAHEALGTSLGEDAA